MKGWFIMFRKTLLAVAAAATLALGVGGATAPAEAKVHIYLGAPFVGFYSPHYHQPYYDPYYEPYYPVYHRRAPYHCHWRRVYRHGYVVRVKRCHRGWD
jgi:hypothetical protein